jgi:hypothetical protein
MGVFFVAFAVRAGRELANSLEGPWTPEERAKDAVRRILVWRVLGAALIVLAVWLYLDLPTG